MPNGDLKLVLCQTQEPPMLCDVGVSTLAAFRSYEQPLVVPQLRHL